MDRTPIGTPIGTTGTTTATTSVRRRTSPRRISAFQKACRTATDKLMREHGYSRERAVATLVTQLVQPQQHHDPPLRPNEDEIFAVMQTYGLGMEQAERAWTIAQAVHSSSSPSALERWTRQLETIQPLANDSDGDAIRESSGNDDDAPRSASPVLCIRTRPTYNSINSVNKPVAVTITTNSNTININNSNTKPAGKKSKVSNNNNAVLPSVITTTASAINKTNNNNSNKRKAENHIIINSGDRPATPPHNKRTRRASSVSLNNNSNTAASASNSNNNNSSSSSKQPPAG